MRKLNEIFFNLPDRKSRFHDAENNFVGFKKIFFYFLSLIFIIQRKLGFKRTLPQINFSSIYILNKIAKFKKIDLLEYGSGYSTLWWIKKNIGEFVSIEDNIKWYEKIQNELKKFKTKNNFNYIHTTNYNENKKFDLIIIDGGDRFLNLKNSISNNLKEDTIIYYDNTDRIVHGERRQIPIKYLNDWVKDNNKFVYTARNFTPYNLNVTAGKFVFSSENIFKKILENK